MAAAGQAVAPCGSHTTHWHFIWDFNKRHMGIILMLQ